jgi:hypothetical protein
MLAAGRATARRVETTPVVPLLIVLAEGKRLIALHAKNKLIVHHVFPCRSGRDSLCRRRTLFLIRRRDLSFVLDKAMKVPRYPGFFVHPWSSTTGVVSARPFVITLG